MTKGDEEDGRELTAPWLQFHNRQTSAGRHHELLKPWGKHGGTISKLFGSDWSGFPGAAAKGSFAAAALGSLRANS